MAAASEVEATENTALDARDTDPKGASEAPVQRRGRRRGTVEKLEDKYPWGRDALKKPATKEELYAARLEVEQRTAHLPERAKIWECSVCPICRRPERHMQGCMQRYAPIYSAA